MVRHTCCSLVWRRREDEDEDDLVEAKSPRECYIDFLDIHNPQFRQDKAIPSNCRHCNNTEVLSTSDSTKAIERIEEYLDELNHDSSAKEKRREWEEREDGLFTRARWISWSISAWDCLAIVSELNCKEDEDGEYLMDIIERERERLVMVMLIWDKSRAKNESNDEEKKKQTRNVDWSKALSIPNVRCQWTSDDVVVRRRKGGFVVVGVVVVVVDETRRNVFGLGINCFDRTSSSILCARRRVRVTRRIQTTRRKMATMVMMRVKHFFRRSLIDELRFNRHDWSWEDEGRERR